MREILFRRIRKLKVGESIVAPKNMNLKMVRIHIIVSEVPAIIESLGINTKNKKKIFKITRIKGE